MNAELASATRPRDFGSLLLTTSFVVLWCTGYPAGKICLDHAAPFTLLVFRFGAATL